MYVIYDDWEPSAQAPGSDQDAHPGRPAAAGSRAVQDGDRLRRRAAGHPRPGRLRRLPDAGRRTRGRRDRPRRAGQHRRRRWSGTARSQSGIAGLNTSFRAGVPQIYRRRRPRSRSRAWASRSATSSPRCRPTSARPTSTTSTCSAAPTRSASRPTRAFRAASPRTSARLEVRNRQGEMVPLGTLANVEHTLGPAIDHALQPLPVGRDQRRAGAGLQLRRGAAT